MESRVNFSCSQTIISRIGNLAKWFLVLLVFAIGLFILSTYHLRGNYILFASIILLIPIFRLVWIVLEAKSIKYEIDDRFVKSHKGILNLRTDTMDVVKIIDMTLKRSIFDRIFGISKVILYTHDVTDPVFTIFGIEKNIAQEIFDFLNLNATDTYVEYRRRKDG